MDLDLDTFLTTVYCIVDDLYQEQIAPQRPVRPGPKPELSDSEVLCLALLAQWQGRRSERAFVAYAVRRWRRYFPRLLSQSAFNRRSRDLSGALGRLGPAIAEQAQRVLGQSVAYEVTDGVPVPLLRKCRANRQRWFGAEAGMGKGGSDQQWYYGVHLLLLVRPTGFIGGWIAGPAPTEERWLLEAVLRWRRWPQAAVPTAAELAAVLGPSHQGRERVGPTGPLGPRLGVGMAHDGVPVLGDLGFRGEQWQRHWQQAYGTGVLTKGEFSPAAAPPDLRQARYWFSGLRQVVETVNGILEDRLGLWFPRAHSYWGLLTRLAAKVAAFNLAVYVNYLVGRPPFTLFDPLAA
jgi:hypothetical protein